MQIFLLILQCSIFRCLHHFISSGGEQRVRRWGKNKAVYTAALVADGWAGAENVEKQFCDGQTNQRTNQPTDRPTDRRTEKWLSRVSTTNAAVYTALFHVN